MLLRPGADRGVHLMAALLLGVAAGVLAPALGPTLTLVAVALAVVGVTLLRWREFPLALLLFSSYLRLSDGLQATVGIPYVFEGIVAFCALTVALRAYRDGPPRGLRVPVAVFLAYAAVMAFSLFVAIDPERTTTGLTELAKNLAVALLIVALFDGPASLRASVVALLAAGALMGGLTAVQQVTGNYDQTFFDLAVPEVKQIVEGTEGVRAGGPLASTNFYAMILVALVPLALDRAWNASRLRGRLFGMLAAALTVSATLMTLSRGGLVALLVVVALMAAWRLRRPSFLITLALTGLVGIWTLSPAAIARFQTLVTLVPGSSDGRVPDEFSGRTSEMLVALQLFADHPIVGVGLGNYNAYYLDYSATIGLDSRREERSAHSLYLEVAAEGGAVGLVVFGLLILVGYRSIDRARRAFERGGGRDLADMLAALEVGLVGYLVASILLHDAFPRYLWLLVALTYAAGRLAPANAERGGLANDVLPDGTTSRLPGGTP